MLPATIERPWTRRRSSWREQSKAGAAVLLALAAALLPTAGARAGDGAAAPRRPNIVLILADDLGFSDVGCYGGEIRTPNIDRLAAGGLRFSQFYNCALCGPTRAALMTGLYPHQVGIRGWTGLLNRRCVTMFELLKEAGYATGAVGRLDMTTADKWHDPENLSRYIDRYFGSTGHTGPGNYFKAVRGGAFYRNGERYVPPAEGFYKTDAITDFAVDFIAAAAQGDKSFFLYVAEYAPHWPLHAKPEDMDKYIGLYRRLGWDDAREQRYRRLVQFGLIDSSSRLSPRDARVPAWEDAPDRDWEAERMAAFAGQVDALDRSVGRICDALAAAGVERNTLVMFLSDNGASDRSVKSVDRPGDPWRVDGTPTRTGNRPDIHPGPADTFVTAGPAWSNLSNAPFRGHKHGNYEGGIATPLVAYWPEVIRRKGAIATELGHVVDIPATCIELAGVEYPARFHGRQVLPIEGRSLAPTLRGEARPHRTTLCWSTDGARAVRDGPWKLVAAPGGPWELYDLAADRTELHDLAAEQPERVEAMSRRFDEWRQRNDDSQRAKTAQ